MKSYKKSSFHKLYLIEPALYEKMLPLLNDVEKQEIIDLNEEHKDGLVEEFGENTTNNDDAEPPQEEIVASGEDPAPASGEDPAPPMKSTSETPIAQEQDSQNVQTTTQTEATVAAPSVRKKNPKRFPCDSCHKAFTTKFSLKRHFKTFHTPANTEPPQTSAEKSVDQKRKVSDMTPNVENETLKKPKWTRGQKRKKSIPQDKVFKQMHLDLKLKSHKCEECGETFNQKGHLKRHINIVHLKLKPYKCEECCKTFSTKDNLKQHCGRPELQTGL